MIITRCPMIRFLHLHCPPKLFLRFPTGDVRYGMQPEIESENRDLGANMHDDEVMIYLETGQ